MRSVWASLLVLAAIAPQAGAKEIQTVSRSYSVSDAEAVRIEFPAGELTVTGTDAERASVTMTARCSGGGRRCRDRARDVRLISETEGGALVFKLEGAGKIVRGLEIDLRVEVPRSFSVDVEMGLGELEVRSIEGDVNVEMGLGEVSIRAPEAGVGSVALSVGIGDATVSSRGHHEQDGRRGLLGKKLRWRGDGDAWLDVELGIGEVGVVLD